MFFKKDQPDLNAKSLKMQVDRLFDHLDSHDPQSPEYAKISEQVQKLYVLRETDSKVNAGKHISPDTWAAIAANIGGIALIVFHERTAVATSKAFAFISKVFK